MKRPELNFRFHDPNTVETAADYILKILAKANQPKLDEAIMADKKRPAEGASERDTAEP